MKVQSIGLVRSSGFMSAQTALAWPLLALDEIRWVEGG